jgi:5,5'-dehydrodivanillate O-demethylase
MGELMRRYWQVVGTSAQLAQDPVQPVRILGEDLTLFRDSRGNLGLIAQRCAHRGISMAYGVPQENGLRCAYHGWTYDTEGHVVDMPFEPACLPLKVTAYPVQELGGLVWAYLGPAPAPLLPRFEFLAREDMNRAIVVGPLPCNWLQCMDNSFDPIHFEHLHGHYGNYVMRKLGKPPRMNPARHLKIEFDVFEYGVYKRRMVEGHALDADDWTIGHPVLFPNILLTRVAQIRVPVDDTTTMHYEYAYEPCAPGAAPNPDVPVTQWDLFENRWDNGTIIADTILKQDTFAWVAQSPISDRTQEHLVTSDQGVMLFRNLLIENLEAIERGDDPMGIVRNPAMNDPYIKINRETVSHQAFRLGIPTASQHVSTARVGG